MRDRELYRQLLGLERPWTVDAVDLGPSTVEVRLKCDVRRLPCPDCGESCSRYDTRQRRWRHLDTMQYQTILVSDVPRIDCPKHGKRQIRVPWAEPGSRFTALFERLTIDWLLAANTSAVSSLLGLSWDEVDGIQQRAVARGLARRELEPVRHLGVDETSFQRRHEYVTVVVDADGGRVLHVADGRGRDSLLEFFDEAPDAVIEGIETLSMDMHGPYISGAMSRLPRCAEQIAFDKFHVAKLLGDAVDKVRRAEHRELRERRRSALEDSLSVAAQPGPHDREAEHSIRRPS